MITRPTYNSSQLWNTTAATPTGKTAICNMLRKIHPDFTENQYVFWLDLSLFCQYKIARIDAKIDLLDAAGNIIQSANTADTNNPIQISINSPFPNKYIKQMCINTGSHRVYGCPLVFNTFDEMSQVKTVRATWTVYEPRTGFVSTNFTLAIEQIIIDFDITWNKPYDTDHHWYTLYSEDQPYTHIKGNIDRNPYGYDVMAGYDDMLINRLGDLIDEHSSNFIWQFQSHGELTIPDKTLRDKVNDIFANLQWDKPAIFNILNNFDKSIDKRAVFYTRQYYCGQVMLYGKESADMSPKSEYGFDY